jgi:hypothetical protein
MLKLEIPTVYKFSRDVSLSRTLRLCAKKCLVNSEDNFAAFLEIIPELKLKKKGAKIPFRPKKIIATTIIIDEKFSIDRFFIAEIFAS